MFDIYKKLYSILDPGERRKVAFIVCLMLLLSVVEVAGVASILPFIAVISDPALIQSNSYLSFVFTYFDFTSVNAFLLFLGACFLAVLVAGLLIQGFGHWVLLRYANMRSYKWSLSLLEGYLSQPYEWYLNRHSSQLNVSVLSEVRQVVGNLLVPSLQLVAHAFTSLLLLTLLIISEPVLASVAGVSIGLLFLLMNSMFRRKSKFYGMEFQLSQRGRQKIVEETFGGIKDVRVFGVEKNRIDAASVPFLRFVNAQINLGLIGIIPNLMTQGFVFGGMLITLMYLIASYGGLQEALPTIALFTFAAYKLLPNMHKIFSGLTTIRGASAVFDNFISDIRSAQTIKKRSSGEGLLIQPITFTRRLKVDGVSYRYPGQSRDALDSVSLEIPAKSTIGLVGSSGSGKTTLVDILLGLLIPRSGAIVIDDCSLTPSLTPSWRSNIGYVSQQVVLLDDSISANVAFGCSDDEVDHDAVVEAAKAANLHKFIVGELPDGYETLVGDKGVRLSGGQRQRIAIARALYRKPDLLIFDEATSALDNITEREVMESISALSGTKTIILIAHRLTTLLSADLIYLFKDGRVESSGTYDELIEGSPRFRSLAMQEKSS